VLGAPFAYSVSGQPFIGTTVGIATLFTKSTCGSRWGKDTFSVQFNAGGLNFWKQVVLKVYNSPGTGSSAEAIQFFKPILGLQVEEWKPADYTKPRVEWNMDIPWIDVLSGRMAMQLAMRDDGSKISVLVAIQQIDSGTYFYNSGWLDPGLTYEQLYNFSLVTCGIGASDTATFGTPTSFNYLIMNSNVLDMAGTIQDVSQPGWGIPSFTNGSDLTDEQSNLFYKATNNNPGFFNYSGDV
jgi:hypothetical protein